MEEDKKSVFDSYESADSVYHSPVRSDDGEIKNYDLTEKLNYPSLFLVADNMPMYRIQVLSNALDKLEYIHEKVPENYYDVYLKLLNKTICLGMIHSDKLRSILQGELFSPLDKYIMLSETERVDGVMMLSLCTASYY